MNPHKTITDVVMFDGASNIQLGGEPSEIHYPNISVMRGVERTVSLFFNDFPISQLRIRLLQLIRYYTTYLVLAYITNLILY